MFTPLLQVRLALALIGVILFGYGVSRDDEQVRLFAIGFLAASALMRWWPKGRRGPPPPA